MEVPSGTSQSISILPGFSRMSDQPILEIAGLQKTFGNFTALHQINLLVQNGEFLTIVGPSGSGKTTLVRLLVGMEEPTKGTIKLRDRRIDNVPANLRPTCMVFQSLALFPHKSVGENIEFPLKIRKENPVSRRRKAEELLDLVRLPRDFYHKRIHQCSGGEKQRVALARGLAFDPEILFFDEPLSALDFRLRKTLEKELKDLHERTGKTFVYITHSLEEAMVMSDRIAIMRSGSFEQIGPADEIYSRPASRFVAEFMGEVNLFDLNSDQNGLQFSAQATGNLEKTAKRNKILMVRPENVRLYKPEIQISGLDVTVDGTLVAEYNLGSRLQYKIKGPFPEALTVELQREQRFDGKPGDAVLLGWNLEQCHLIPKDEPSNV